MDGEGVGPDGAAARKVEQDRVAATSLWIAAARAAETARQDSLFSDPWAESLAGERGRAMFAAAPENPFLPVRTRYFDDRIRQACRPGTQLVLLGAGMDTRAFRLPLPASCAVYELDQAGVLEAKNHVLDRAHAACARTCIVADLAQPWMPLLHAAGFDPRLPTIWIAEGLLFYLSAAAVDSLLADTAEMSAPGSVFLADTFGTGLLETPALAPLVLARDKNGRELPFCTDDPGALFRSAGWSGVDVVQPGQPRADYGRFPHGAETRTPDMPATLRTYLVAASVGPAD